MGYTKRKANSNYKVLPDNFEEIKKTFLADIQAVVEMEDVPPSIGIILPQKLYPQVNGQWKKGKQRGWKLLQLMISVR